MIRNSQADGIHCGSASPPVKFGVSILDNDIIGPGNVASSNGIRVQRASGMIIAGNRCINHGYRGIDCEGVQNSVIAQNTCANNGQNGSSAYGILLQNISTDNSTSNLVLGNNCFDDQGTATQADGIILTTNCNNNAVVMNRCIGNITNQISDGATGTMTFGNKLSDSEIAFTARRLKASLGTSLAATDFTLTSGWGTSASVSSVSAVDQGGRVTVTSGTTALGANPTVKLTFRDGTWTNAPAISYARGDLNAPTTAFWALTTISATAATWTFVGTPAVSQAYVLDFTTMGH
jgi:parallel beta-helix repeat protein